MASWLQLSADDGHRFSAYHSKPSSSSLCKGRVVIIQEVFGVNQHIRDVCDRFSESGFETLAPSLFDRLEPDVQLGYLAEDVEKGRSLRSRLEWDDGLKDTIASIGYLAQSGPVAVVGFCYGGTIAWLAANKAPLRAAVCYYGSYIHQFRDQRPQCPALLHFGALDHMIPLENIEDIKDANTEANLDICIYPEAGHGFNCNLRDSSHEPGAELAWQRTLDFLSQNFTRA
jgi:carboxymethylenebutenolidase